MIEYAQNRVECLIRGMTWEELQLTKRVVLDEEQKRIEKGVRDK